MSHRWQTLQPRRRSPRRRQPPKSSGLCLGPLPRRHPGRREGWWPSFQCGADRRVCRNVHERSSSPLSFITLLGSRFNDLQTECNRQRSYEGPEGRAERDEPEYWPALPCVQSSRRNNSTPVGRPGRNATPKEVLIFGADRKAEQQRHRRNRPIVRIARQDSSASDLLVVLV